MKAPKQCTIMVPSAVGLPSRCEGRCFKAGRCAEHYRGWRQAREARGIEQREFRAKQIAAGKFNAHGRITPPTIRVEARRRPEKHERKAKRAIAA